MAQQHDLDQYFLGGLFKGISNLVGHIPIVGGLAKGVVDTAGGLFGNDMRSPDQIAASEAQGLNYNQTFQNLNTGLDLMTLIGNKVSGTQQAIDEQKQLARARYNTLNIGQNPNANGVNNIPIYYKNGGSTSLTPAKAKEILKDGTIHGKPITDKQRRYFAYIAWGGGDSAEHDKMFLGGLFKGISKIGSKIPLIGGQIGAVSNALGTIFGNDMTDTSGAPSQAQQALINANNGIVNNVLPKLFGSMEGKQTTTPQVPSLATNTYVPQQLTSPQNNPLGALQNIQGNINGIKNIIGLFKKKDPTQGLFSGGGLDALTSLQGFAQYGGNPLNTALLGLMGSNLLPQQQMQQPQYQVPETFNTGLASYINSFMPQPQPEQKEDSGGGGLGDIISLGLKILPFVLQNGGQAPIHIKESHKGEFTRKAKAAGKTVQEYANYVLTHKEDFSVETRKQANFAKNFGGKKQTGGLVNNTGYLDGYDTSLNPVNIIPSNDITMNGVSQDIMAFPNVGQPQLLTANSGKYQFPGATQVTEVPVRQNGGSVQQVGSVPNNVATSELEKGEVFQTNHGDIVKVAETEKTHGDGGSKQNNVDRVLEDTSDKRTDINSKLLKIKPEDAYALTGFKPKSSVTHSKLFEQAAAYYDGESKKQQKQIQQNLDYINYKNGGKIAQNSLQLNLEQMQQIPNQQQLFDTIYNHQEQVKQKYQIDQQMDDSDVEKKSFGGTLAKIGKGLLGGLSSINATVNPLMGGLMGGVAGGLLGTQNNIPLFSGQNLLGGLFSGQTPNGQAAPNPLENLFKNFQNGGQALTPPYSEGSPQALQAFDDYYSQLQRAGYTGSQDIGEMQNWLNQEYPGLVNNYMTSGMVPNTNYGIAQEAAGVHNPLNNFNDNKWWYRGVLPQDITFRSPEQLQEFIKDKTPVVNNGQTYYVDPKDPTGKQYGDNYGADTGVARYYNPQVIDDSIIPTGPTPLTPQIPDTAAPSKNITNGRVTDQGKLIDQTPATVKKQVQAATPSKFNVPLQWYDTAGDINALLDASKREPVALEQLQRHPLQPRLLNPLPTLLQNLADYNAAVAGIPNTGVGMANKANLLGNKYNINNQVLGQYENQNRQLQNQYDQYNQQNRYTLDKDNLNLREQFTNKVLASKEAQRQQRMEALNGLYNTIAQNRRFNTEGQLILNSTPYFDQEGRFNHNSFEILPNNNGGLDAVDKKTGQKYTIRDTTRFDKNGLPTGSTKTVVTQPVK